MKRVLLTGDWHCGNVFGLTPPEWEHGKFRGLQNDLFSFFEEVTKDEYDVAILTGDLIDGGIEAQSHVTVDRSEQVEMANQCIDKIKAKKVYAVLGTPLHTGGEAVFERFLAKDAVEELRLSVNGLRMHVKHKVSISKIGYGQETLLAREAVGQATYDMTVYGLPKPRLVVRAHAHRYVYVRNEIADGLIVPCLQYPFSWYGATISKWLYTMGVVVLIVSDDGDEYEVRPYLIDLKMKGAKKYEKV